MSAEEVVSSVTNEPSESKPEPQTDDRDEDTREYTQRLYWEGKLSFSPHCRCGDQGCTACMI